MSINDRINEIADTVSATRADVSWIRERIQAGEQKIGQNRDAISEISGEVKALRGRWRAAGWIVGLLLGIGGLATGIVNFFR